MKSLASEAGKISYIQYNPQFRFRLLCFLKRVLVIRR
jgi:hypothetical protein